VLFGYAVAITTALIVVVIMGGVYYYRSLDVLEAAIAVKHDQRLLFLACESYSNNKLTEIRNNNIIVHLALLLCSDNK